MKQNSLDPVFLSICVSSNLSFMHIGCPKFPYSVRLKKKQNFHEMKPKKMMLATKALQISCQFLPISYRKIRKGLSQTFIASGRWNVTLSLYAVSSLVETTEDRISEI